MLDELNKIWEDQADFNSLFRNIVPTRDHDDNVDRMVREEQTKTYILGLFSEVDELLREFRWKHHRKETKRINIATVKEELIDIFKYWISTCLVWSITPEDIMKEYWRKSAVCRQRYSEEYVLNLDGKIAIVDIDGVLSNYQLSIVSFALQYVNKVSNRNDDKSFTPAIKTLEELMTVVQTPGKYVWLDYNTVKLPSGLWGEILHTYRTGAMNEVAHVYNDARSLMNCLRKLGFKIVVLTSRPIDKYSNIYTETLRWLKKHELEFDCLWWASDKIGLINNKLNDVEIALAIDDDYRYVKSYVDNFIKTIWITNEKGDSEYDDGIVRCSSLRKAINQIKKEFA